MRSCAELVQQLSSSHSLSELWQAAAAALLALPLTPETWVTAVGAMPALVETLTLPAGATEVQQLALQVMRSIVSYRHRGASTVRTASGAVVAALVSLIQHSRDDVCSLVVATVASLAFNSDNQVRIKEAGAIPQLVQLLKSGSLLRHAPAAAALANLSAGASSIQAAIVAAGAVAPLVHLLKSSSHLVQSPAAMALRALCRNGTHSVAVARAGAIPPLIRLLASECAGAQSEALQALGFLSCKEDIIGAMVAAGAVPQLARLLTAAVALQEEAALILANLAVDDRARIGASGAIAPLAAMLKASRPAQTQGTAAMALRSFACEADSVASIVSAGAIPLLVAMLPSASAATQEQAVLVLKSLATHVRAHEGLLAALAGAILPLIRLVDSGSPEDARDHAMMALLLLSAAPPFPRQFFAAGAIPPRSALHRPPCEIGL